MNVGTNLIPFININLKWITDLTFKCKIIKLIEGNIGESLNELGFSDDFLDHQKHNPRKKESISWNGKLPIMNSTRKKGQKSICEFE